MKKNQLRKYQLLGISFFSVSYLALLQNTVYAEDVDNLSSETSSMRFGRYDDSFSSTSNSTLNSVLETARQEGISLVETEFVTYNSQSDIQNDYLNQIQTISEVTTSYRQEKEDYTRQLEAYRHNQKEQESYRNDLARYHQYLKDVDSYNEKYAIYQKDYQQYEATLSSNKLLEETYKRDLESYNEQLLAYKNAELAYQNSQSNNVKLKEDYNEKLKQYDNDLKGYIQAQKRFEEAKKLEKELKAKYDKELAIYHQNLREYELEKALYDEKLAEAESNTKKEGYLSQVHAQYLIFKSESNARVTFENVSDFFSPSHQFGGGLSGIGGKIDDIVISDSPHLFEAVGGATAAGPGDGYGVILEKGKPITVTYNGLEKSSYNGRPITKVVYTYELTSTFATDGKATAFIYTDPTKTIYVGTSGDNQGQTDLNIHQTITYYYSDGERVRFTPNTTALLSFASRNNTFEFGEQEYVIAGQNMTFIPITGSSVSGDNNYIAARGSNNSIVDGSRFNRDDWDKDGHPNEYYGAGVVQVIGDDISFDFGIRYSREDIDRSANPVRLRNGSRQWFTVNSDLKASGILQETLRDKPEAPKLPQLDASLLVEPVKPLKPEEPAYQQLARPVKPLLPIKPTLTIPSKPIKPIAPTVIAKPVKPDDVPMPIGILKPIVFYHRNYYKPSLIPSIANKKAVETSKITAPRIIYVFETPKELRNPVYQPVNHTSYGNTTYNGTIPYRVNTSSSQLNQKTAVTTSEQSYTKLQPNKEKRKVKKSKKDKLIDNFKKNLDIGKTDNEEENQGKKEKQRAEKKAREASKATLDYIDYLAKELNKKHKGDKAKVNRDLALMLAYEPYHSDKLQQMLNYFVKPYGHKNKSIALNVVKKNHDFNNSSIDFAHTMTTLASLEDQSGHQHEVVKGAFSLNPFYYALLTLSSGKGGVSVLAKDLSKNFLMGKYNRDTILQLNSFVGDAYTTNSKKDIYSDMDAVILSKHPAYKDLQMNERIKKYYGQSNLNAKREKLFLEVYDKNKNKAQKKAALEMLEASLTLGGILALGYGLVKGEKSLKQFGKNAKRISQNIALTDTEVLGNTLDHWRRHPLKAIGDIADIYGERLVNNIKTKVSSIGKTLSKGYDKAKSLGKQAVKYIGKKLEPVGNFIKKIIPKPTTKSSFTNKNNNVFSYKRQRAFSKNSNAISAVVKPFVKFVKPVVNKVTKPIIKHIIKPIVKRTKPIVNNVKRIFKPTGPQKRQIQKKGRRKK